MMGTEKPRRAGTALPKPAEAGQGAKPRIEEAVRVETRTDRGADDPDRLIPTPETEWRGPVHPGRILKDEFLIPEGLTQKALAEATGLDEQRISQIIRCERAVSPETSVKLGDYLRVSGRFFLDIQVDFEYCQYLTAIGRSEMPERPGGELPPDAENMEVRAQFLDEIPCITVAEWQASGHAPSSDVMSWLASGAIFLIEHERKFYFPLFQFRDHTPHPVIAKVLATLPADMSAWQVALWFVSGNGWLDGAMPVDRLEDEEALTTAATREGEVIVG